MRRTGGRSSRSPRRGSGPACGRKKGGRPRFRSRGSRPGRRGTRCGSRGRPAGARHSVEAGPGGGAPGHSPGCVGARRRAVRVGHHAVHSPRLLRVGGGAARAARGQAAPGPRRRKVRERGRAARRPGEDGGRARGRPAGRYAAAAAVRVHAVVDGLGERGGAAGALHAHARPRRVAADRAARLEAWRRSIVHPINYPAEPAFTGLSSLAGMVPEEEDRAEWMDAVRRAVDQVAGLTAVDGATIIDDRYDLLAFEPRSRGRGGSAPVERVVVMEPVVGARPAVVDVSEIGGNAPPVRGPVRSDQPDARWPWWLRRTAALRCSTAAGAGHRARAPGGDPAPVISAPACATRRGPGSPGPLEFVLASSASLVAARSGAVFHHPRWEGSAGLPPTRDSSAGGRSDRLTSGHGDRLCDAGRLTLGHGNGLRCGNRNLGGCVDRCRRAAGDRLWRR
jgi:hypothetical protein